MSSRYPELAAELDAAEHYAERDPRAALMYLRIALERTVRLACKELAHYGPPPEMHLNDIMLDERFTRVVSPEVLASMHEVRMSGNRAVHGKPLAAGEASRALRETARFLEWAANRNLIRAAVPRREPIEPSYAAARRRPSSHSSMEILGFILLYVIVIGPFIVFLFAAAGSYIAFFAHGTPFTAPIPTLGIVVGVVVAILVPVFAWRTMDD